MHCLLSEFIPRYEKMRDTVSSEMVMKTKAYNQGRKNLGKQRPVANTDFMQYLRPTEGMTIHPLGEARFADYVYMSKWYPYPLETLEQSLGMLQNKPPEFELPASMEFLRTNATPNYESLESALNSINNEQLITSRCGIVLESTNDQRQLYNICKYNAEAIVDWYQDIDSNGELKTYSVQLLTDEVSLCNNEEKPVYLILYIDDNGEYSQFKTTNEKPFNDDYSIKFDSEIIEESVVTPKIREKTLDAIPFIVVNVKQLGFKFEKPFLEKLSDSSIKTFQASANYEYSLYWAGKNTLFTQGFGSPENPIRVGDGAVNCATNTADNATAWYATAGVDGIDPSRQNLEANKADCVQLGVDLLNQGVESGIALNARTNIKTASLKTLAKTAGEGLQKLLRIGAKWLGVNEEEVVVSPNLEFGDMVYTADDLTKINMLVDAGRFREEDYYNIINRQGMTSSEDYSSWALDLEKNTMEGSL